MTALRLGRAQVGGAPSVVALSADGAHDTGAQLADLLSVDRRHFHHVLDAACREPAIEPPKTWLTPVDEQEVWASGVTYESSREARVAESDSSDAYIRVYDAARPELFMKAPAARVTAPGAPLRIRQDSSWDVPEPELGLLLTASGETVGFLVGDDLSSRSIEADNPLYLPQAKQWDDCVALSPVVALARDVGDGTDLSIQLMIARAGKATFSGSTSTARMHRTFNELRDYLFREMSFPHGVVLLTGTGLVPPDDFTLQDGDEIEIEIAHVGTLRHGIYRSTKRRR